VLLAAARICFSNFLGQLRMGWRDEVIESREKCVILIFTFIITFVTKIQSFTFTSIRYLNIISLHSCISKNLIFIRLLKIQ
jgi:hypothetical protein